MNAHECQTPDYSISSGTTNIFRKHGGQAAFACHLGYNLAICCYGCL